MVDNKKSIQICENSELERKKMLLATIIKKVVVSGDKKIYIEFNNKTSQ